MVFAAYLIFFMFFCYVMSYVLTSPIFSPQVFGHQRSPSMEFKELTKKDAQVQLTHELQKLSATCPQPMRESVQLDFDGFEKLFSRFINESGPSVEWDRIQKLPEAAVSCIVFYSAYVFVP